ncbi:MAG: peptidylprolyl isomerase [Candidatus Marinimicrobia bacterium]|nr:peptidylprolyl isomerase [Candidatus Neomarinimicrobiota bacterium]
MENAMKYILSILFILMIMSCGNEPQRKSISTLNTFSDSTSYALGADLGENLKRQQVDIDYDVFIAGLMDGRETDLVMLDQKQRRDVMASLQRKIREQSKLEGEKNLQVAEQFLEKNKKDRDDINETPTGLQYRVINEGSGDRPNKTDRVKVHYVGRLIDGSVFDSSIERGEPTEFGLNQVIKGWTEGLQLMKVGAKYEFFIHPKIAYGARPRPTIPANSVLIFEVELLDIITKN